MQNRDKSRRRAGALRHALFRRRRSADVGRGNKIAPRDLSLKRKGFLIVVSGPSGVGKSTLVDKMVESFPGELVYSISATTRPRRSGEFDGRDYYFYDRETFQRRVHEGAFLEWAEFCGQFYGTPRAYIEESLERGAMVILDIELKGAAQVKRAMPEGVFIFLAPPSWEALRNRITGRGTESPESITNRLHIARAEIEAMGSYQYVVVNDDRQKAFEELASIIRAERCRVDRSDVTRLLQGLHAPTGSCSDPLR